MPTVILRHHFVLGMQYVSLDVSKFIAMYGTGAICRSIHESSARGPCAPRMIKCFGAPQRSVLNLQTSSNFWEMPGSGRSRRYGAGCRSSESGWRCSERDWKRCWAFPWCRAFRKQSKAKVALVPECSNLHQDSYFLLLWCNRQQSGSFNIRMKEHIRTLMSLHSDRGHPGLWMCWLQGRARGSILLKFVEWDLIKLYQTVAGTAGFVFLNFTPLQICWSFVVPLSTQTVRPSTCQDLQPYLVKQNLLL